MKGEPLLNPDMTAKGAESYFLGERIGDFDKDELLALIWWIHEKEEQATEEKKRYDDFMKEIHTARSKNLEKLLD